MANRNITFSLPEGLIKTVKVYAAQHDTSVNALVKKLLEETVSKEKRAQLAMQHFLELAEAGPYFTDDPADISRDELHERR